MNMSHGHNGLPLARQGLGHHTSLDNRVVAAVDESYSNRHNHKNLMHLAVVCSLPQTLGRESPPRMVLDLLRNTERYGFIVAGLILPPWTTSKALTWREGVWYGLAFIDAELQKHGHPKISVAYIDGAEPGGFRDSAPLDGTPEVIFAPKYGTHSYDQNLGPLGVSLLKLADMAAGQFRKQSDSRPGLDDVVKALSQSQQPRVVQLRGLNGYNGNVPV